METTIKILVLLVTSLTLYSCGGGCISQQTSSQSTGSLTIKRASSSDELANYLKSSLINNHATEINEASYYTLASYSASDSETGAAAQTFSTTNAQESSVDEADRLKTDGNYLYTSSINGPEIKIFGTESGAPEIATYPLQTLNKTLISGLYLRDETKQLLAVSGDGRQSASIWDMWFDAAYWEDRKTEVFTLDINNPSLPELQDKLTLDGQLISSRRIGSTLYLATRHTPTVNGLIEYPESSAELLINRGLINFASLDNMLPSYQVNDGRKQLLFDVEDCFISDYAQPKQQQTSIISLLAIDLDAATPTPRGQCFVGDAETVYASTEAFYLATTHYQYNEEDGFINDDGQISTEIHKFALDSLTPDYRGTGSVAGHLGWQQDLKPFRMSEHNDVLRIITYTGNQADGDSSPAHLYTLAENTKTSTLDILGSLPNEARPALLGKLGEQIYATRFIGSRAYLVTFRTTDPLYIVDLSNPSDPFIASELEINGYSDYLHPVGENYLLGIGKDAVASTDSGDGRGAWDQGVKLSLIDISDASAPYEKQQIILGKRGSNTAVSSTHHALTSLLKGDSLELALPVSLHETAYTGNTASDESDPSTYYNWTRNSLYRLSINTITGDIQILPEIEVEPQLPNGITAEYAEYFYGFDLHHDRSAIIGDTVYYLQGDRVTTN